MTLRLIADGGVELNRKAGEILKEQLAQVGIKVDLQLVERNVMLDRVYVKRDFDMHVHGFSTGADPAIDVSRLYVSTNIRPVSFTNGSGYRNPKVDDLFDAGSEGVQARGSREGVSRGPEGARPMSCPRSGWSSTASSASGARSSTGCTRGARIRTTSSGTRGRTPARRSSARVGHARCNAPAACARSAASIRRVAREAHLGDRADRRASTRARGAALLAEILARTRARIAPTLRHRRGCATAARRLSSCRRSQRRP